MPCSQKGIAHIVLIILAVFGIAIGLYLVQTRTNFLPKAQQEVNLTPQTAFHLLPAVNYRLYDKGQGSTAGGYGSNTDTTSSNESAGGSGKMAPTRTWFYPGEEIRVNVAVSSDIDAANTFSAVVSYPTDLLEVVAIQKESNDTYSNLTTVEETQLTVSAERSVGEGCKVGGCSGEACVNIENEDLNSVCGYDDKGWARIACVKKHSTCEKQQNGQCGWTQTPELQQCLATGGKIPEGQSCTDNTNGCSAGLECQQICPDLGGFACEAYGSVCRKPKPSSAPISAACGVSCNSSDQCAGAKDGCTSCLPKDINCPTCLEAIKYGEKTCQPPVPGPSPSCRPRPACLDSEPRCLLPETSDMCPPTRRSPAPSCKPIPSCVNQNPACDLYIDPSDPSWCHNQTPFPKPSDCVPLPGCYYKDTACINTMDLQPGKGWCPPSYEQVGDYFIRHWLPDTKFDNETGLVVLSGGVSGAGVKTAPANKPIMATIIFKARKIGEAKLGFSDDSLILRNSDSANILVGKNGITVAIKDKTVPVVKGDLDGDGSVGYRDFSILLSKWGSDDKKADINGDGKVNIYDFSIMLSNWSGRSGEVKLIQKCPEEWIQNLMPGTIEDNLVARGYFIYEGKRRETSEFDVSWVKARCNIQPQKVY